LAVAELDWEGELPDGAIADHLDSLQRMALVVAVEDEFQIVLEPDDEERIETIDDLVTIIRRKRDA
jgi:acyl carrier protein